MPPEAAILGAAGPTAASQSTAATYYGPLTGDLGDSTNHWVTSNEIHVETPVHETATIKLLTAYLETNKTVNSTLSLRKNQADPGSGPTLTLTASTSGLFRDTTNTASVASGDEIDLKLVVGSGGTGTVDIISHGVVFETSGQATAIHQKVGNASVTVATATRFIAAGNGAIQWGSVQNTTQCALPGSVTADKLTCYVSANGKAASHTFRCQDNGANGAQVVTVAEFETGWFTDTSNSDSFAADDLINYAGALTGTSATVTYRSASMRMKTATANQAVLMSENTSGNNYAPATTAWVSPMGEMEHYETEAWVHFAAPEAGTWSRLTVRVTSFGSSANVTVKSRKNGADGNQTLTVTGTGVFKDTTNSDTVAAGDRLTIQFTNGATGNTLFINTSSLFTTGGATEWTIAGVTMGGAGDVTAGSGLVDVWSLDGGAVSGAGSLSGDVVVTCPVSDAAAAGAGALAGTIHTSSALEDGALAGSGTLSGDVGVSRPITSALEGAGALSGSPGADRPVSDGALSGAGSASATIVALQQQYPDGVISAGGWTREDDSPTNLHLSIDEVGVDDADYIKSALLTGPSPDAVRLRMSDLGDPFTDDNHEVVVRAWRTGAASQMVVRLYEGATLRAERTFNSLTGSPVDYAFALTAGEAAAIVDYADLELEIEATLL